MHSGELRGRDAARAFPHEVPRKIQVGIVTFAGSAQVAQQATVDRPSLIDAIDRIRMQRGTAIGSAIVLCLAELLPDHGLDLGEMTFTVSVRHHAPASRTKRLTSCSRPRNCQGSTATAERCSELVLAV